MVVILKRKLNTYSTLAWTHTPMEREILVIQPWRVMEG